MKKKSFVCLIVCVCLTTAMVFTGCGASATTAKSEAVKNSAFSANDSSATIDLGNSEKFTKDDLNKAVDQIKTQFAAWKGCELENIRYAGDEASNEENLAWMNDLRPDAKYTQVVEFFSDFKTPENNGELTFEPNTEYKDYQWWLARTEGGDWDLVTFGY